MLYNLNMNLKTSFDLEKYFNILFQDFFRNRLEPNIWYEIVKTLLNFKI